MMNADAHQMNARETLRVSLEFLLLALRPVHAWNYLRAAWLLRDAHVRELRNRILVENPNGSRQEIELQARQKLGPAYWIHPTRMYNRLIEYVGWKGELVEGINPESPREIAAWITQGRNGVLADGSSSEPRGDGG